MHLGSKAGITIWICLLLLWSCPPLQDQVTETLRSAIWAEGTLLITAFSSQSCCDFAKDFSRLNSSEFTEERSRLSVLDSRDGTPVQLPYCPSGKATSENPTPAQVIWVVIFWTQVSLTSFHLWLTQKYRFCLLTCGLAQLRHKIGMSLLQTNHRRTHTTCGNIEVPVAHQKNKSGFKKSQHQIFALHHVAAAVYLFQKQESKSLIYCTAKLHPRTQNRDAAKAQQVDTNPRSQSEGKEAMRLIRWELQEKCSLFQNDRWFIKGERVERNEKRSNFISLWHFNT